MVKSKYSGEEEVLDKIKALFSYRKLTGLLHAGQLDKDSVFIGHLTDIQYQIYLLDAYLESQWDLDQDQVDAHWKAISTSLSQLAYTPNQMHRMLAEIREYERIERNCRKNTWPTKVKFKKFYTTKSCDVRLIRHLIYDARPALRQIWKEEDWKYYDLITEINDDIADLSEDLLTYNGNRFLISILRKGRHKTLKQYRSYLMKVTSKAETYFRKHHAKGDNAQLKKWTIDRSVETLKLLDSTLHRDSPAEYTIAYLLKKMQ
jgi:hypothetical protein